MCGACVCGCTDACTRVNGPVVARERALQRQMWLNEAGRGGP